MFKTGNAPSAKGEGGMWRQAVYREAAPRLLLGRRGVGRRAGVSRSRALLDFRARATLERVWRRRYLSVNDASGIAVALLPKLFVEMSDRRREVRIDPEQADAERYDAEQEPADEGQREHEEAAFVPVHHGFAAAYRFQRADLRVIA